MKKLKLLAVLFALIVVLTPALFKIIIKTNAAYPKEYKDEVLFDESDQSKSITNIDESANNVYSSSRDFPDAEILFADELVFKELQLAYAKVDFYGEFKEADKNLNSIYKSKYNQLLQCEVIFIDKEKEGEYYLNEYEDFKVTDPPEEFDNSVYTYLYFDMNEDGSPELCIQNDMGCTYIFSYEPEEEQVYLLHKLYPSYYQLNGSNKIRWDGLGGSASYHLFHQLRCDGEVAYTVYFFIRAINNPETEDFDILYMLTFPQDHNQLNQMAPSDAMAQYGYYDSANEVYYYRLTENQFNSLIDDYWKAIELAKVNKLEVTYTYDELFNF